MEADEKESGRRRLLNFGHTIAHAIETLSQYTIAHGEAVAIGILVESHIAMQLGCLEKKLLDRLRELLVKYGLPMQLPANFTIQDLLAAMSMDKKAVKGSPRFVIIDNIGSAKPFKGTYCTPVDAGIIKNALQWMVDDLCRH